MENTVDKTPEQQWAVNQELAKKVASDVLKKSVDRDGIEPGTYHVDETISLHVKGVIEVGKDQEKKGSVTAAILWKVLATLGDDALNVAAKAIQKNQLNETAGRDLMVKNYLTEELRAAKVVKNTESKGPISGKGCMVEAVVAEVVSEVPRDAG